MFGERPVTNCQVLVPQSKPLKPLTEVVKLLAVETSKIYFVFSVIFQHSSPAVPYASEMKTVQHSGYWIKYNSTVSNYASVIAFGEVVAGDITAEVVISSNNVYILIRNNVRNTLDPAPNYLLKVKYKIDVVNFNPIGTTSPDSKVMEIY